MALSCRICQSMIGPFMSFGKMPIANGFLKPEAFATEYFFELAVGSCLRCGMFQLMEQPEREKMFHDHYAFFSGTSRAMAEHFREFADEVKRDYCATSNPFVVEIGSNDGSMLEHFAKAKIRHLGVEPSSNVAEVARSRGINTVTKFFDEATAREIVATHGHADALLGANVTCHIPNLHAILEGAKILLKPEGVFVFEDPYLGDVIANVSYDQIYDEHVFLFSAGAIQYLAELHGLELIAVWPQETHGGSMRYALCRRGKRPVAAAVATLLLKEQVMGLGRLETYDTFRQNCEDRRKRFFLLLTELRKASKRIVGYAATSKSTTILNYCNLTPEHIDFISDTTPLKHGTYSPGAHIPVRPYEEFTANYPDYALLFAYNHAKEIMAKEQKFIARGGKWIVYVPDITVLEA